ncbi:MAG: hypothetical protein FWD70_01765 [Desulfuromonadales bacterium]|nr:hypothetical protein [Desulfuromonadales bacterium]
MQRIIFVIFFLALQLPVTAFVKELRILSLTYSIREQDVPKEVENRAKPIDWRKVISAVKSNKYRLKDSVYLLRTSIFVRS